MTKEEAKKTLNNTKVYVNGKSKEIQKKLFGIGFQWPVGDKNKVDQTDCPFIYMHDAIIRVGCDMEFFIGHEYKEISAEDILNIDLNKFKDGDIIKSECATLVYRGINKNSAVLSDAILVSEILGDSIYIFGKPDSGTGYIGEYSLAINEERKNFLDRLKEEGYKFNEETKEVEKIKEEHKFKPFEKVLVRNHESQKWAPKLFWKMNLYNFRMIDFSDWGFCIPYDGNEDLIDTENNPKV